MPELPPEAELGERPADRAVYDAVAELSARIDHLAPEYRVGDRRRVGAAVNVATAERGVGWQVHSRIGITAYPEELFGITFEQFRLDVEFDRSNPSVAEYFPHDIPVRRATYTAKQGPNGRQLTCDDVRFDTDSVRGRAQLRAHGIELTDDKWRVADPAKAADLFRGSRRTDYLEPLALEINQSRPVVPKERDTASAYRIMEAEYLTKRDVLSQALRLDAGSIRMLLPGERKSIQRRPGTKVISDLSQRVPDKFDRVDMSSALYAFVVSSEHTHAAWAQAGKIPQVQVACIRPECDVEQILGDLRRAAINVQTR